MADRHRLVRAVQQQQPLQDENESWDMAITHPLAYGFDQAWGDLSSPLPASWEHHPTVPPPHGWVSRGIGEGTRGLLDFAGLALAARGAKGAWEKFGKPRIVKQVRKDLREQMRKRAKRKAKKERAEPAKRQRRVAEPQGPHREVKIVHDPGGGRASGNFKGEYTDKHGRRYKPLKPSPDGRRRFQQENGVIYIERNNGHFIPERAAGR